MFALAGQALAVDVRCVREVAVYRAALYLPSVLPIFALTFSLAHPVTTTLFGERR